MMSARESMLDMVAVVCDGTGPGPDDMCHTGAHVAAANCATGEELRRALAAIGWVVDLYDDGGGDHCPSCVADPAYMARPQEEVPAP